MTIQRLALKHNGQYEDGLVDLVFQQDHIMRLFLNSTASVTALPLPMVVANTDQFDGQVVLADST